MSRTIMVTGATGLVGANVCALATRAGDDVVALVRNGSDTTRLEALGVRIVRGDVADSDEVSAAAAGVDAIVHCAAVLGGTYGSTDPAVHDAINLGGMTNVLDAAAANDAKLVAISTTAFFAASETDAWTEHSPYSPHNPVESQYTRTKRAAQQELDRRAEGGQHVQSVFPGAIYGPSPVPERAVEIAGQNAMILRAIRGELPRYPAIAVGWVLGEQVARRALLAIDRGVPGGRYLAMGDSHDSYSFPAFLSLGCELAGVEYRVAATPRPSEDPTVVEEFGPFAYMSEAIRPVPAFDDSETRRLLDDPAVPVAVGLPRTVEWFKQTGEI